ncbi:MAG: helix-turn-helix domain-containing protein [Halobacteriaceae archaeon]
MRALAALLVLAFLSSALAAPAAGAPTATGTAIDIHLADDGDARWTVSVRYALESENETAAFRRLGERFERGDADALSADTFRALAARASAETGREMRIVDVNRTATVRNRSDATVGVLTLRFRWTNFAQAGDTGVRLGDVFVDGLELERGQTLRIHPPEGHAIESLPPVQEEVTDGVIRWEGPVSFEPGEPSVTYVPSAPGSTTTSTSTPIGPNEGPTVGAALVGGIVLGAAAIVLTLGAYGLHAHGTAYGWLPTPGETAVDADDTGEASGPDAETGAPPDEEDGVDEELLSDEERVERLLARNGGRMKQANIVSETGWSNAKVSQLLSSMAEEGRVEKLQLGRENLISLPDHEET